MDINVIKNALEYKKQHLHLAHYLLNKECSISTFVEGQIDLKKSTNYEKLKHLLYSEETLYKLSAEYWVKKIKSKT